MKHLLTKINLKFMMFNFFLGYCLLPVIGLAGLSILVNMKGLLGVIFASITIAWSTFAATRCVCVKKFVTMCVGFSAALMLY